MPEGEIVTCSPQVVCYVENGKAGAQIGTVLFSATLQFEASAEWRSRRAVTRDRDSEKWTVCVRITFAPTDAMICNNHLTTLFHRTVSDNTVRQNALCLARTQDVFRDSVSSYRVKFEWIFSDIRRKGPSEKVVK